MCTGNIHLSHAPATPMLKKHRLGTELLQKTTEHRKKKPRGDGKNPSRDEPSGNGNFASLVPCIFSLETWNCRPPFVFFLGGGWVGDTFDDPLKTEQQNHWSLVLARNVLNMTKKHTKQGSWKTPMVSWFRFCWFNYFWHKKKCLSNTIYDRGSRFNPFLSVWGCGRTVLGTKEPGKKLGPLRGWNVRGVSRPLPCEKKADSGWYFGVTVGDFNLTNPFKRCWLVGDFHQLGQTWGQFVWSSYNGSAIRTFWAKPINKSSIQLLKRCIKRSALKEKTIVLCLEFTGFLLKSNYVIITFFFGGAECWVIPQRWKQRIYFKSDMSCWEVFLVDHRCSKILDVYS